MLAGVPLIDHCLKPNSNLYVEQCMLLKKRIADVIVVATVVYFRVIHVCSLFIFLLLLVAGIGA